MDKELEKQIEKDESYKKLEELATPKPKQDMGLPVEDSILYDEVYENIQKRKRETLNKKKRAKRRGKIILAIIVFVVGMIIFSFSSFFDVDSIDVIGNSYFTPEEIVNMAHAEPGQNLIYHPNKRSIIKYLEANPYIKDAKVTRGLPSTLIITVTEREQLGAIKYDDDFLIIDDSGILLRKTRTVPKVTVIEGMVVKKIEIGSAIEVKDKELFDQTLDILTAMRDGDLYFVNLDMRKMYIEANIYENLVCKGTYKQMIDGIKKGRLHKVLNKLFKQGISRGTITFSGEGYASFLPTV